MMNPVIIHPQVQMLLTNYANQKVPVYYSVNAQPFLLPQIGKRPPFYTNPVYEPYYPLI